MRVTEFIEARLSETEWIARRASERSECWTRQGTWWLEGIEHQVVGNEEAFCHPHNAGHIALNDPAHVLAWVAAIRAVVEMHHPWRYTPQSGEECSTCGPGKRWPCPTNAAIAAIWTQHPDFESEWA